MNTTKIFCELVEEWNYIAKWKTMGLFREPYGCVHLHDLTCLLISKNILHTLLLNTSNLFWEITFPFSSFPLFLQFWTRCLNFLQLKHNFPFLPSSSSLNLERKHFYLSKLLINELYCSWDIMVTFQDGYEVNDLILLLLHLLEHKIFTQPDIYCPTDYYPSNIVILSPQQGGSLL